MEDPRDVYRRQTAVVVLVVAALFWLGVVVVGFATQASFFSMEEYLRQPMWTEDVPWLLNVPLTTTAVFLGVTRMALFACGVIGLVLLFSRRGWAYPDFVDRLILGQTTTA